MIHNIINAILNLFLNSLSEELCWIFLILVFVKRFDLLDKYMFKENIKWIILPVLLSSISINIFTYIVPNFLLKFFITTIVLYFSLNYILIKTDVTNEKIKWYKIIIGICLSMIVILMTEMIYVPLVLSLSKNSIEVINNNILFKFIFSLPAKTFQIMLVYFAIKKNNWLKERYINNVLKDKILSIATVLFVGLILFLLASIIKLISISAFFGELPILTRIIVSVTAVIIPTILLFLYIIPINYLLTKIFKIQQSHQQMFEDDFDV